DERDFEFAKKFGLQIPVVIGPYEPSPGGPKKATSEYGVLINSGDFSGMPSADAKTAMTAFAEKNRFGEGATTYRLRDWGISRQRFWGSPIPIVYCETCGTVPEKYENLPVRLPENAPITGTGESPLAKVPEFYETTCPKCDGPGRRETDTMDTFVDSSWYFFRYTDSQNEVMPFDPAVAAYWTPVDQYIGGDDHAIMHLIYARFWTKVMRDLQLIPFSEPFKRLLTQGMVVGETFFDDSSGKRVYFTADQVGVERDEKGRITSAVERNPKSEIGDLRSLKHAIERMSKSKGNGVDPDEMVEIYGADAARLFVMFAAPIENELVWNEAGIEGAVRFLQRVWRLVNRWNTALSEPPASAGGANVDSKAASEPPPNAGGSERKLRQKTHQTIKRVGDSFESLQFNTPVAALMELSNAIGDVTVEPQNADSGTVEAVREALTSLVLMLAPFSPHTAEELYSVLVGNEDGMLANDARFPDYQEELAKADEIEIPVQINGKLRSCVIASPETPNEDLEKMAFADEKVREYTDGKEIVKVIVVPKRLVNIVLKEKISLV
ncbi:MAG: class I tRNA ligase family protein, partial [Pyrinomonadaceae bacterium]